MSYHISKKFLYLILCTSFGLFVLSIYTFMYHVNYTCELLNSISHPPFWYNDWEYIITNSTFYFSDVTSDKPISYKCCVNLDTLYVIDCNSPNVFFITTGFLLFFTGIVCCLLSLNKLRLIHIQEKHYSHLLLEEISDNNL